MNTMKKNLAARLSSLSESGWRWHSSAYGDVLKFDAEGFALDSTQTRYKRLSLFEGCQVG